MSAAEMMRLFAGFAGAYGTYSSTTVKKGKVEIKGSAQTIREPVTTKLWEAHLAGERPLGIIPINVDNCCVWGCIDVDKYDISHAEIVQLLAKRNYPMVVCRTKSGGAHLFLFTSAPVPAEEMREQLKEIAAKLGFGGSEIFPKQNRVLTEQGDLGSWLNMPYFDGDNTDRYAVRSTGMGMSVDEFVEFADRIRITPEELAKVSSSPDAGDLMAEGPPCLEILAAQGVERGSQNNAFMAFCTFAKKKYGSKWKEKAEEMNRLYFRPPIPSEEVVQITKRLDSKEYNYICSNQPLCDHCNSGLCKMRKFGISGGSDYPVISGLSVLETDPPLWFLDIDGHRLEMSTEDLQNYRRFHKICMERLVVCFGMLKQDTWFKMVAEAMKDAVRVQAPEEVGTRGAFMELLRDFCVNRHRAQHRDEIVLGRPWEDEETGRHYFRLRDLKDYLERNGMKDYTRPLIVARIREMGGGSQFFNLRGTGVNVWWVPAEFSETPAIDTPEARREVL